ncbi:MAG: uracil-DNA glycosylase family protein [Terriglobia bacterium]
MDMDAWNDVQDRIWSCEICRAHPRVACDIRQRTEAPSHDVRLLLVGVAPPYVKGVTSKTLARSATNDRGDNLRKYFVLATLPFPWEGLLARGMFLIHGVKCAITPKDRHQNPPNDVVDACAPLHFVEEVKPIRPPRVVVFGKAPYRALLKVPGMKAPRGLGVSKPVAELVEKTRGGVDMQANGWRFSLHVSPFPLDGKIPNPVAQEVLKEAAHLSGIMGPIKM